MLLAVTSTGLGLSAAGCAIYEETEPETTGPGPLEYRLIPVENHAVEGGFRVLTWDGEQFWCVNKADDGDYWSPDPVEVFRYDPATRQVSGRHVFASHWETPTGATWAQGKLWIHYDANGGGVVTTYDPATDLETTMFSVSAAMNDIATDGTSLYLANTSVEAYIELRDLATGAIIDEQWSQSFRGGLRGIAVTAPDGDGAVEVWGGGLASNNLTILKDRLTIATATAPGIHANGTPVLQFKGSQLAFVDDNQLYLFDVVRPTAP